MLDSDSLDQYAGVIVFVGAIGHPDTFKAHGQVSIGEAAERMTVPLERSVSLTTIQRLLTDIRQYD